jgi:hypothetical protein
MSEENELNALFGKYASFFEARDKESFYSVYAIRKKGSAAPRIVAAPNGVLRALQRDLVPFIRRRPVNPHASAYEPECSTLRNARVHTAGRHILHLDIRRFFPSISKKMFTGVFCPELHGSTADKLWEAVSFRGGLPIGACTSPFIANRILYRLDRSLARLKGGVKYTRYADDMIFSSRKRRRIPEDFLRAATDLIREAGFRVNDKKTYFMSGRRQITGIILYGKGKLSTGTTYKKRLKSAVYNYLTKGEGDPAVIKGRLAYLQQIEPAYYKTLRLKYIPRDNKALF